MKKFLLLFAAVCGLALSVSAQTGVATGRVVDETGGR